MRKDSGELQPPVCDTNAWLGIKGLTVKFHIAFRTADKFDLLQESILKSLRFMSIAFGILVLVFLGSTTSPCASSPIQFFERNSTGVTLYSNGGAVQIDVCSDRIVHVIASPTPKIPPAIVPTVIHLCRDSNFKVVSDKSTVAIRTAALEISIDRETGALRFLSADGKSLLSEPRDGGRTLTPATIDGTPTFHVQQEFLTPPEEALYGLGQHQEGLFNLRSIPLRLQQANTNISIPVLLSTKGYGLIWNNASLTDFNVADEPIQLDVEGKGSFHTGPAGEYGFLLGGNERGRLRLSVGGETIIDLHNMWVPDSAGAKINLKANTEYQISAQTGGETQLFMRPPSDTTEFRSEAGRAVDYYFLYGPQSGPSHSGVSRDDRSPLRCCLAGLTAFGSAGSGIQASSRFWIPPLNFVNVRFRWT